jgi:hypothetical protein
MSRVAVESKGQRENESDKKLGNKDKPRLELEMRLLLRH